MKTKELTAKDSAAQSIIHDFERSHPSLHTDIMKVVDHIEHVIKLAGIDHVGFGSDFDGVGDSLPVGLKDVSAYPNILYELLKRGYTENILRGFCSGNLLRVWRTVEKVSQEMKS